RHIINHLPPTFFIIYFLYRAVHLPDLHPFPTRRSSDLTLLPRPKVDNTFQQPPKSLGGQGCIHSNGLGFEHHRQTRHDKGHTLTDRKSTRLNSSHVKSSYAVFCLKKKKKH